MENYKTKKTVFIAVHIKSLLYLGNVLDRKCEIKMSGLHCHSLSAWLVLTSHWTLQSLNLLSNTLTELDSISLICSHTFCNSFQLTDGRALGFHCFICILSCIWSTVLHSWQRMTKQNDIKFKCQCLQLKFYGNTAMLIIYAKSMAAIVF